jgi:hypothetical protein
MLALMITIGAITFGAAMLIHDARAQETDACTQEGTREYCEEKAPKPARYQFRPWQAIWQCNDISVTVTSRQPEEIEYDLGGSIWGGSRFNVVRGALYFNGRPCFPLRPIG